MVLGLDGVKAEACVGRRIIKLLRVPRVAVRVTEHSGTFRRSMHLGRVPVPRGALCMQVQCRGR